MLRNIPVTIAGETARSLKLRSVSDRGSHSIRVALTRALDPTGEAVNVEVPAIDPGNTAWVLVSAALVLFMTPGLAFFYGGMVRAKNVLTMLMQNFFCMGL